REGPARITPPQAVAFPTSQPSSGVRMFESITGRSAAPGGVENGPDRSGQEPELSRRSPAPAAVLAQLERLRRSPLFSGCNRLMEFLRFVVDETLAGRGKTLKESVIGHRVYRRDPLYDPRIDSTVRVEARRLRSKLQEFYAGDGRLDPVVITVPTGGYVAVF